MPELPLSPHQMLSPQSSSRTIFGTKRRSEAVNSRNILNSIIQKTAEVNGKSVLDLTERKLVDVATPKKNMSGVKVGPLKAMMDTAEKDDMIIKPRKV